MHRLALWHFTSHLKLAVKNKLSVPMSVASVFLPFVWISQVEVILEVFRVGFTATEHLSKLNLMS